MIVQSLFHYAGLDEIGIGLSIKGPSPSGHGHQTNIARPKAKAPARTSIPIAKFNVVSIEQCAPAWGLKPGAGDGYSAHRCVSAAVTISTRLTASQKTRARARQAHLHRVCGASPIPRC